MATGYVVVEYGVRRRRVVTFTAIRLRGPGFKPRLQSHPSGGEGVSPVQVESIRRRYIKPEYLPTYMLLSGIHAMEVFYKTRKTKVYRMSVITDNSNFKDGRVQ